MPMIYRPPTPPEATEKVKRVLFWISSSRGTNEAQEFAIGISNYREGYLKGEVEEWCEQFGAWHASENSVGYGWATCSCRKKVGHMPHCEISKYIASHKPRVK